MPCLTLANAFGVYDAPNNVFDYPADGNVVDGSCRRFRMSRQLLSERVVCSFGVVRV